MIVILERFRKNIAGLRDKGCDDDDILDLL